MGRLMLPKETSAPPRFKGPMPASKAERLPLRERLELIKPILREHQADPRATDIRDRDPYRDSRWSWIYEALGGHHNHRSYLGQARHEIECEDKYGHYWQPAWATVLVIDSGWNRYEAEVDYPRPIRRSQDTYTRSEKRQFHTRQGAERWVTQKKREYERYVLRLLREGVYDDYGYDR